jgi:hypothetical protein
MSSNNLLESQLVLFLLFFLLLCSLLFTLCAPDGPRHPVVKSVLCKCAACVNRVDAFGSKQQWDPRIETSVMVATVGGQQHWGV